MAEVHYAGTSKRIVWADDNRGRLRGKEYFNGLPSADQAKFQARFVRLADYGQIRNPEHFRSEGHGIYCFKISGHRLVCFFLQSDVVITHGFKKAQQKMPRGELEQAKHIRAWYESRS